MSGSQEMTGVEYTECRVGDFFSINDLISVKQSGFMGYLQDIFKLKSVLVIGAGKLYLYT